MYTSPRQFPEFKGLTRREISVMLVDVQKKKKAIPICSIGVALLAILVFVVSAFALDDMFGENWAYGSVPIASLCLYLGNVMVLNGLTYPEVRKTFAAETDAMV